MRSDSMGSVVRRGCHRKASWACACCPYRYCTISVLHRVLLCHRIVASVVVAATPFEERGRGGRSWMLLCRTSWQYTVCRLAGRRYAGTLQRTSSLTVTCAGSCGGSIACNAPYAWLRVFNNACVDPTSPHTSPPASTRLLLYERCLVSISIVTYQSVKDFRRRKLAQIYAFAQAFGVSTNGPMLIPSRKCFKEMPRIDAEVYAADRIFDEFTMSTKNVLVMLLLGFKDHRYQIHQSATKPV